MRPKPPSPITPPKVDLPGPSAIQPPRLRPEAEAPLLHQPSPGRAAAQYSQSPHPVNQGHSSSPEGDSGSSRLEITDSPTARPVKPGTSVGLNSYLLKPAMLRGMQPADDEGFRYIVGRKFVDVKNAGTVYVEFDARLGTYRATDLYKKLPPGPALYKHQGELTWSPPLLSTTESTAPQKRPLPGGDAQLEATAPAKRPKDLSSGEQLQAGLPYAPSAVIGSWYPLRAPDALAYYRMQLKVTPGSSEPEYFYGYRDAKNRWVTVDGPPAEFKKMPNDSHAWLDLTFFPLGHPDAQGYYRIPLKPASDSEAPLYLYVFKDSNKRWVKVDPPPAGFNELPTHLTSWTDHQIWQVYGIHGSEIERFRVDAEASGSRPQWAKPIETGNPRAELLNDSLRWLYPRQTPEERALFLRSYNLSPQQHARLRQDLIKDAQLPQWAEQHKKQSQDANNPSRFDHLQKEIEPLLLPLRNGTLEGNRLRDFEGSISRDYLDAFLAKLGYLRNKNNCLYRTDIPGLFRADERTPFELANDGQMRPRMRHPRGATTEKPISATVSLEAVRMYGRNSPDPKYLSYNSQTNKYPGKKPGEPDDGAYSSDSEWSDSSVSLDSERDYETTRHNQKIIFTYVIDTRKLEVVLKEENEHFNLEAKENDTWFPEDDLEALISASQRGISTDRIWLLDSTLTRAAKVDDVAALVDTHYLGNTIEERTHNGAYNKYEYDALIEAAADAGKPILKLGAGKDWFANDIVWPENR